MSVKTISVSITDSEVISISKTRFKDVKGHIEVMDFHLSHLYQEDKISLEDYDKVREILSKINRDELLQ